MKKIRGLFISSGLAVACLLLFNFSADAQLPVNDVESDPPEKKYFLLFSLQF